MIDIKRAERAFKEYLNGYDIENERNKLKIVHTYGVVNACEYIAKDLKLNEEDTNLAKLIALLHDIGRFEQVKLYNSFIDNMENNDHAYYGVKALFEDGLIRQFIDETKYDDIIYKAIFNHNKYKIEGGLNDKELLHAKLVRDADKTDNFRVKYIEKFETLFADGVTGEGLEQQVISENIFNDFMNNRMILREDRKTNLDVWVSYIAFIFDYNFNSGLKYIQENDYINKLVDRIDYRNPDTRLKMESIRKHATGYIKRVIENG
jgi:putative nucleotidyltransferase with HDIG domain